MGSKKDINPEGRHFVPFVVIATVLAVFFLFVKKDNLIRWIQAGFTIRKQERQMQYLRDENERLDGKIRKLSNDRDSLERYARETYYFSRADEDVYIEP